MQLVPMNEMRSIPEIGIRVNLGLVLNQGLSQEVPMLGIEELALYRDSCFVVLAMRPSG